MEEGTAGGQWIYGNPKTKGAITKDLINKSLVLHQPYRILVSTCLQQF